MKLRDLVIGLDCSTTACKVIIVDMQGKVVSTGRADLPIEKPRASWHEQPADSWWESACRALREAVSGIDNERLAAMAIAAQRETFVLTDESGHPLANAVAPGKRPRSAMSPVIVLDAGGRPVLALGSPGGSRIIGYVLRALVASLDEGLSPGATVSVPLILSRNGPTEIDQDAPATVRASLAAYGQTFIQADLNSGLAVLARRNNMLEGAADPRREGKADGF